MIQEDKQLLLQDLCTRLPYGVKVSFKYVITSPAIVTGVNKDLVECNDIVGELEDIKPYLFPLSSMTKEQYEQFIIISGWDGDIEDIRRGKFSCIGYIGLDYIYDTIDWFNKNHFDYRGLIEKGLAIDATGLNIY